MNAERRMTASDRPSSRTAPNRDERGFTLLEVLVALAILAIALGALIKAGSTNTANAVYLRDKTFAHWVALNTITEMQVREAWPNPGNVEGTGIMGDREWDWIARVEKTPDATVRRVTVEVRPRDGEGEPLVRLVGFLQEPVKPDPASGGLPAPGGASGSQGTQQNGEDGEDAL